MMRRKLERVVTRLDSAVEFLGLAGGELGFGLRHIGARHDADIVAAAGLFQCRFENLVLLR